MRKVWKSTLYAILYNYAFGMSIEFAYAGRKHRRTVLKGTRRNLIGPVYLVGVQARHSRKNIFRRKFVSGHECVRRKG